MLLERFAEDRDGLGLTIERHIRGPERAQDGDELLAGERRPLPEEPGGDLDHLDVQPVAELALERTDRRVRSRDDRAAGNGDNAAPVIILESENGDVATRPAEQRTIVIDGQDEPVQIEVGGEARSQPLAVQAADVEPGVPAQP